MPDERAATLEELLAYETPAEVFDFDLVRYPSLNLTLKVRGLQDFDDIASVRQKQRMCMASDLKRRQLADAIGKETISDTLIGYCAWLSECLITEDGQKLSMEQVAKLASKTGVMVEELATRAMVKSGALGIAVENLKNSSGGETPPPRPKTTEDENQNQNS